MGSMNEPDFRLRSDADLLRLVQSRPAGDLERQAACEILVERYQSIVRSCAYRYRTMPELSEDLMQVGYVGLMKAINNFDPEVGENLASYAQPCVSGEIKRYFRDKRWQIRVSRSAQELRLRISAVTAELSQQLSRPPSDAELAAHLGVTEAEVADTQVASQAFHSTPRQALLMTPAAWAS
jgi:RNA polymerase sigma-B factor